MKRRSFWTACAALVVAPWKRFGSTEKPPVADPDIEAAEALLRDYANTRVWQEVRRLPASDFVDRYPCSTDRSREITAWQSRIPARPNGDIPFALLRSWIEDRAAYLIDTLVEVGERRSTPWLVRGWAGYGREVIEFHLERRADQPDLFRARLTLNFRTIQGRAPAEGKCKWEWFDLKKG